MNVNSHELSYEDIRFGIEDREISALEAATAPVESAIRAKGYNLIVTGLPGTGKRSTVMQILEKSRTDTSRLRDIVFVYNFDRPENPPAGDGGSRRTCTGWWRA